MKEVVKGVHSWEHFLVNRGFAINGFYLTDGPVFVDPPSIDPYEQMEISRLGPPRDIIITIKDHMRNAEEYRKYYRAKIWAHRDIAKEVGADRAFINGDMLPGGLRAVEIPHNKPGETALYHEKSRTFIVGDALISKPDGLIRLPDSVYENAAKAREGVKVIFGFQFDNLLVSHGTHITGNARKAVFNFIEK